MKNGVDLDQLASTWIYILKKKVFKVLKKICAQSTYEGEDGIIIFCIHLNLN